MSQTSSLYHHLLFLILIAQIKLSLSEQLHFTNMKGSRLGSFLLFEFELCVVSAAAALTHPERRWGRKREQNWGWKFLVTPYVFTQHEYIIYLNWSNSILNTILLPFLFSLLVSASFFSATLENPSTSNVVLFFSPYFSIFLPPFSSAAAAHNTQKWWRWLLGIFHLANREVCKCWYFLCKCISSSSSTAFMPFSSLLVSN